jgi:hypothetical protein
MKPRLIAALAACSILSACGIYGTGETVGYVYAVDDGIIWDKVWYKSTLESSQGDCYLIDNDVLKAQLRELSGKQKVKLTYARHFYTFSRCPEGTGTKDEITGITLID